MTQVLNIVGGGMAGSEAAWQAAQAGMDPAQAQAFLDAVGMAELKLPTLLRLANTPNYVNQLRFQPY